MTAIELYKFIRENEIEYHWHTNSQTDELDVIIFIENRKIEAFHKLLGPADFEDGGIICNMKDGYFAYWAGDICDKHGIELTDVFD